MKNVTTILFPSLFGRATIVLFCSSMLIVVRSLTAQDVQCQNDYRHYLIMDELNMKDVAIKFGSKKFTLPIYMANADPIVNPMSLIAGQTLNIPYNIYYFREQEYSVEMVLANPFCKPEPIARDLDDLSEEETLEAFRKAFGDIVEEEEGVDGEQEEALRQGERRILTEIDGMIHDETRSKIGRDFYDIFYTRWQPPAEAANYTIRVTEQPAPSMGTFISVEVNNSQTFKMRLQPRYDFIEEAATHAIQQTRSYMEQGDHTFRIY